MGVKPDGAQLALVAVLSAMVLADLAGDEDGQVLLDPRISEVAQLDGHFTLQVIGIHFGQETLEVGHDGVAQLVEGEVAIVRQDSHTAIVHRGLVPDNRVGSSFIQRSGP